MARAVFLDRDGVLNRPIIRARKPHPPATVGEVEILPGVPEACQKLKAAGFLLIVVTNQPDVARGAQRRETVEEINQLLRRHLPLDDIRVCYHDTPHGCHCRKPAPGLLREAAAAWGIELADSFMVGDRWTDIEAGHRAGCRTILIRDGYGEERKVAPDGRAASLPDAVNWILKLRAVEKEKN
jgi:D-glycero-D-manno-heptose 1,7-bisphosphate phosphatase